MPVGCYVPSKSMSIVELNVLRELSVFKLKKSNISDKCGLLQLTEITMTNQNSDKMAINSVPVIIRCL